MYRSCLFILIAVLLFGVGGCQSGTRLASPYDTVGHDPKRDTETAKQENAAAVRLLRQGESEAAEQALKRALAADIMFGPAHNNLGKLYFEQRRFYRAAWEFQYATKLMPRQPEPRNNLGLVFEAVGQLEEAIDAYADAYDLEPDNPQIIGNLARARVRRGDHGEQTRDLLLELVMKDDRPEWIDWARSELRRLGHPVPN